MNWLLTLIVIQSRAHLVQSIVMGLSIPSIQQFYSACHSHLILIYSLIDYNLSLERFSEFYQALEHSVLSTLLFCSMIEMEKIL